MDVQSLSVKPQRVGTATARKNHILGLLPEADFARLTPYLDPVHFKAGETIYHAGERQMYAYFPTSCVVMFVQHDKTGHGACVAMYGSDGMVGLSRLLQSQHDLCDIEVQATGQAWRVPMDLLQREFFRGGTLMHLLLRLAHFEMKMMSQRAICNRFHRMDQQVSGWLSYMQDITHSDRIATTQRHLAQLLGMRRQGVSETLGALQAEGLVRHERGVITVINRLALTQRSCGCCEELRNAHQTLFQQHLDPPSPIAKQRMDEGYLAKRVEMLENALSSSHIAWWELDLRAQANVQTTCDTLATMLGYSPGTFNPSMKEWHEMVHPDDEAKQAASFAAHLNGQTASYESEYRIRHIDGHWVWLHSLGHVVERDGRGSALRMIGTSQDISAHKNSELALERLTRTDHLTQVANRMHFFEVGEREFERAQRHGTALTLLCMDMDHFKGVNDRYGHAAGDAVLQEFAHLISSFLRVNDLFARVGGEEFSLLLPQTDADGAVTMARRILDSVRDQTVITDSGVVQYTVSIGICTLTPEVSSWGAMLKAADQAMYHAKALGRDRAELTACQ